MQIKRDWMSKTCWKFAQFVAVKAYENKVSILLKKFSAM